MELREQDGGRAIALRVGETATIVLAEARTGGYRWKVEVVGDACALTERPMVLNQGLGARNERAWDVIAVRNGESRIVFAYARPWERRLEKTLAFAINVRDG